MAYLVKEGIADFAVSEDSDLIAYGCPRLVTKLSLSGTGQIYSHDHFKNNKTLTDKALQQFQQMSREQFVQACIMAGCEYLPSIQGVGLKVTLKQFAKSKTVENVIEAIKAKKNFSGRVSETYLQDLL